MCGARRRNPRSFPFPPSLPPKRDDGRTFLPASPTSSPLTRNGQDDRFCYHHVADSLARHLLDEEDEKLGWDLPDDGELLNPAAKPSQRRAQTSRSLRTFSRLTRTKTTRVRLPSIEASNRQLTQRQPAVLPSASHPSYPYGNPYAPRNLANPSAHSQTLPSPLFRPASHAQSLATTLPVLGLRHLFSVTTFGEPRDRGWNDMGLEDLLADREEEENGDAKGQGSGEPPQPTGQNAGDHPPDEEEPVEAMDDV